MSTPEQQEQLRAAAAEAAAQHAAAQEQSRKFAEQLQAHGQAAAAVTQLGRQG
ncbi:hypothetical protein ACJBCE_36870 [Streptomyces sp. NBUL23]|uniref:hypothetical protein n=1 Tax=Streptomyces sp. NBUL23 TaxID=3381354 RepID=UPI003871834D